MYQDDYKYNFDNVDILINEAMNVLKDVQNDNYNGLVKLNDFNKVAVQFSTERDAIIVKTMVSDNYYPLMVFNFDKMGRMNIQGKYEKINDENVEKFCLERWNNFTFFHDKMIYNKLITNIKDLDNEMLFHFGITMNTLSYGLLTRTYPLLKTFNNISYQIANLKYKKLI